MTEANYTERVSPYAVSFTYDQSTLTERILSSLFENCAMAFQSGHWNKATPAKIKANSNTWRMLSMIHGGLPSDKICTTYCNMERVTDDAIQRDTFSITE